MSFSMHFYDLPLVCFSRSMTKVLGNAIGSFEKVEADENSKKKKKSYPQGLSWE